MSAVLKSDAAPPEKHGIVLYYYPLSYFSQKVRMALLEKNIPHALELVDITAGENYQPWFVKLNPSCEVPVLSHGTKVISGSQKIIDYLEDTFTQGYTSLSPDRSSIEYHKTRYLRDAIDALPMEIITFGCLRHPELTEKIKVPDYARKGLSDRFTARQRIIAKQIDKHPELRASYTAKLNQVEQNTDQAEDISAVNATLNQVETILDKIEEHLRTNAFVADRRDWWLSSAQFTVADISLAILLSRLYFLGFAQRFWSIASRPYLAIYYQRLNDRPSFQKVAVTHITTGDLMAMGGASLLYTYGLSVLGVATVAGVFALGAIIYLKRRK